MTWHDANESRSRRSRSTKPGRFELTKDHISCGAHKSSVTFNPRGVVDLVSGHETIVYMWTWTRTLLSVNSRTRPSRVTLETWEWPGDRYLPSTLVHQHARFRITPATTQRRLHCYRPPLRSCCYGLANCYGLTFPYMQSSPDSRIH